MLTVREVAESLRVSPTCVYQLIEKGKIACHRIGLGRGAIRVCESDLAGYVESCRKPGNKTAMRPPRPRGRLRHLKQ
ncbi:helix-turn-helix domain-containing protein [Bythopirellula goksoeyrii]